MESKNNKSVRLSNARHERLLAKNKRKCADASLSEKELCKAYFKCAYHRNAVETQECMGRVLSREERKFLFEKTREHNGGSVTLSFTK